jgi:hypothetical protein
MSLSAPAILHLAASYFDPNYDSRSPTNSSRRWPIGRVPILRVGGAPMVALLRPNCVHQIPVTGYRRTSPMLKQIRVEQVLCASRLVTDLPRPDWVSAALCPAADRRSSTAQSKTDGGHWKGKGRGNSSRSWRGWFRSRRNRPGFAHPLQVHPSGPVGKPRRQSPATSMASLVMPAEHRVCGRAAGHSQRDCCADAEDRHR